MGVVDEELGHPGLVLAEAHGVTVRQAKREPLGEGPTGIRLWVGAVSSLWVAPG